MSGFRVGVWDSSMQVRTRCRRPRFMHCCEGGCHFLYSWHSAMWGFLARALTLYSAGSTSSGRRMPVPLVGPPDLLSQPFV